MSGGERGGAQISQFFVGVDLGQVNDPTAIAVVERAELVGAWDHSAWAFRKKIECRLRGLTRLPLGMKYTEIERNVVQMVEAMALRGKCEVLVDATGVGIAVVDYLRESLAGRPTRAVMVTPGQTERSDEQFDYVPKRDLMVGLELLLERDELKIAKTLKYGEALKKEMADMRVKVTPAGHEQFGAWRQGEHDDLVFAVALACWGAGKRYPRKLTGREAYWIGKILR